MKLHENGAYLIQGKNVVIDSSEALKEVKGKTGKDIDKNEAKQNTIAYNILKNHNTSGNMEKLQMFKLFKYTHTANCVANVASSSLFNPNSLKVLYGLPDIKILDTFGS